MAFVVKTPQQRMHERMRQGNIAGEQAMKPTLNPRQFARPFTPTVPQVTVNPSSSTVSVAKA